MISGYRRLFSSEKTFMVGFIATVLLLPVSIVLSVMTGSLTVFDVMNAVAGLALLLGLRWAYKKGDLIRMSGLSSGIMLMELCRFTYLAEWLLGVGNDGIVALGFYACMALSGYIMICFILVMLTVNHFTMGLFNTGVRTRIIVNQLSIVFLLLCFVGVNVTGLMADGDFLTHLTALISFMVDQALFVDVACCELILAIDSMQVRQE